MKTAVSLPDELFAKADKLADRLGIARSQLYALALADYLDRHAAVGVTDQLNAVYGSEPSGLDASLAELQAAAMDREISD